MEDGDLRLSYPVVKGEVVDADLILRPWKHDESDCFKCWIVENPGEGRGTPRTIHDVKGQPQRLYVDPKLAIDDALIMLGWGRNAKTVPHY